MNHRIAVIDDEPHIRELLSLALGHRGYTVRSAADGAAGLALVREWSPDLIVLDVMMPKASGIELLPALRRVTDAPIVMLSARGEVDDKVEGLAHGADDYLSKPFEISELLAHVEAKLRRPHLETRSMLEYEGLTVDLEEHVVERDGRRLDLSPLEYELARHAAAPPAPRLHARRAARRRSGATPTSERARSNGTSRTCAAKSTKVSIVRSFRPSAVPDIRCVPEPFARFARRLTRGYVVLAVALIVLVVATTSLLAFMLYVGSLNEAIGAEAQRVRAARIPYERLRQPLNRYARSARERNRWSARRGARYDDEHQLLAQSGGRTTPAPDVSRAPPQPSSVSIRRSCGSPAERSSSLPISQALRDCSHAIWRSSCRSAHSRSFAAWLIGRAITRRAIAPLEEVASALRRIAGRRLRAGAAARPATAACAS